MTQSSGDPESVLRRKLRPRPAPPPAPSGGERSLTRAATKAISAIAGLTADFGAVSERGLPLDEGLERLPDDGHVALLTAADGATGLVAMDEGLFAALVEAITLGRLPAQAPPPRPPTSTDAALLAAVIEPILAEIDAGEGQGWRIARNIADLRLLRALMDEGAYRLTQAPVALSDGAARRGGVLTLLLAQPAEARPGGGRPAAPGAPAAPDAFRAGIEAAVMAAPVQLDGVLGRVSLPLAQLMALRVGHRFELPLAQLEEVQVVGLDGRPRALARLGQTRGMRAVRIMAFCDGAGRAAPPAVPALPDAAGFVASGVPPSAPEG